ncbi:MAG TPA: hypothetical protein VGO40_03445 [Longimicrobium sp.]|jgi:hypothetical protein|nr:hypothetical protein [Longimicrobium sp.]
MSKSITLYVRGAFALFLLGLGMYAGAEGLVAHELASRGLATCGAAEHPCELAPLTVTAARTGRTAAATAADRAMQVLSAAPRAPHVHPVATAES